MLHTDGNDEIFGLLLLQQEKPNTLYIVLSIATIAEAIHIAQVEAVLQALTDASSNKGDLAGKKGLATSL